MSAPARRRGLYRRVCLPEPSRARRGLSCRHPGASRRSAARAPRGVLRALLLSALCIVGVAAWAPGTAGAQSCTTSDTALLTQVKAKTTRHCTVTGRADLCTMFGRVAKTMQGTDTYTVADIKARTDKQGANWQGAGPNALWQSVYTELDRLETCRDAPQPSTPPPAQPTVQISAGAAITEGGTASFTISVDSSPTSALSVSVKVTQSGDYAASGTTGTKTVTFSAYTVSSVYTIRTVDDLVDEADGSITVTVVAGSGYTVGSASTATVAVRDDDVPVLPQLTQPSVTIKATGGGTAEGYNAYFVVTADPKPTADLTVNLAVSETTTNGQDYVASGNEGTKSVVIGTSGTARYTVPTVRDSVDEADGGVTVTVSSGSGYDVGTPSAATFTVKDDDVPTATVTSPASVTEGTPVIEYTIRVEPAPRNLMSLAYRVHRQNEPRGRLETAAIAAGSTTKVIPVFITSYANSLNDGDRTVTLELVAPTDANPDHRIANPSSAVTIVKNDDKATVSVDQPDPSYFGMTRHSSPVPLGSCSHCPQDQYHMVEGGSVTLALTLTGPRPPAGTRIPVRVTSNQEWFSKPMPAVFLSEPLPASGKGSVILRTEDDTVRDAPNDGTFTVAAEPSQWTTKGSGTATIHVWDRDGIPKAKTITATQHVKTLDESKLTTKNVKVLTLAYGSKDPQGPVVINWRLGSHRSGKVTIPQGTQHDFSGGTLAINMPGDDAKYEASGDKTLTLSFENARGWQLPVSRFTVKLVDDDRPSWTVTATDRRGTVDENVPYADELFDLVDLVLEPGAPAGGLTVNWSIPGLSGRSGTVTVPVGDTRATIRMVAENDVDEPSGNHRVNLSLSGSNAARYRIVGSPSIAFKDDDPTYITLVDNTGQLYTRTPLEGSESKAPIQIFACSTDSACDDRTAAAGETFVLPLTVSGCSLGTDCAIHSGLRTNVSGNNVTFSPRIHVSSWFWLEALEDTDQVNEVVTFSGPSAIFGTSGVDGGMKMRGSTVSITLQDNDSPVTTTATIEFSRATGEVREGNFPAQPVLVLSTGWPREPKIRLRAVTAGTTVTFGKPGDRNADIVEGPWEQSIGAGSARFSFDIKEAYNDDRIEGSETLIIEIDPSSLPTGMTLKPGGKHRMTITIFDDDAPSEHAGATFTKPNVWLEATQTSFTEGAGGTKHADYAITVRQYPLPGTPYDHDDDPNTADRTVEEFSFSFCTKGQASYYQDYDLRDSSKGRWGMVWDRRIFEIPGWARYYDPPGDGEGCQLGGGGNTAYDWSTKHYIRVHDDSHDEGNEGFTIRARHNKTTSIPMCGGGTTDNCFTDEGLSKGFTIGNTDAMPSAWLARFGRTVATHALDGIAERVAAPRTPGTQGTLAGHSLVVGAPPAGARGSARTGLAEENEARTLTAREALRASSFSATGESDAAGGSLAVWGRGAHTSFAGSAGTVSLDGDVTTAMLGADYARDRWLVGLAVARSDGEGDYTGGDIDASLTAAIPYASLAVSERLKLWAGAGLGSGEVALETGAGERLAADIDWTMAAAGMRGRLLGASDDEGGAGLAIVSDALWSRTTSERTAGMVGTQADVTRLRLGLEASWKLDLEGGGHVRPKLEVGARHDGGDAETGLGVELGGGIAWSEPALGLTLDLSGRALLAHDSDDLEERGFAGSLGFDPAPATSRGPSFSLRQAFGGQASGGLDALFAPDPLGERTGGGEAASRWAMEAAWGLPAFGGRFTGSPHAGLGLSPRARDYTLGWRLTPEGPAVPDLTFGVKATRRESDAAPEHAIGLEVQARW